MLAFKVAHYREFVSLDIEGEAMLAFRDSQILDSKLEGVLQRPRPGNASKELHLLRGGEP